MPPCRTPADRLPGVVGFRAAFAFAEGAATHGSVYFSGNVAARGARIQVFDPDGVLLAETTMDAADHFTITAARRVDHRMVDGHLAEFTVPAAELPDSLASTADPEPLPAVAALSEADPPVSQVPRARHSKR